MVYRDGTFDRRPHSAPPLGQTPADPDDPHDIRNLSPRDYRRWLAGEIETDGSPRAAWRDEPPDPHPIDNSIGEG